MGTLFSIILALGIQINSAHSLGPSDRYLVIVPDATIEDARDLTGWSIGLELTDTETELETWWCTDVVIKTENWSTQFDSTAFVQLGGFIFQLYSKDLEIETYTIEEVLQEMNLKFIEVEIP